MLLPDRTLLQSVKEVFTGSPPVDTLIPVSSPLISPGGVFLISLEQGAFFGGSGGIRISTRETILYTYEASVYSNPGLVNQPELLEHTVQREGVDANDGVWKTLATEDTVYSYDDLKFLTGQTTSKRAFDPTTGSLAPQTMRIETLRDVGALLVEKIVEDYAFDATPGQWTIQNRQTALTPGHRPGGPGRGRSLAGMRNASGLAHVALAALISSAPNAVNVEYQNDNLSAADLAFIMVLFQATLGAFEYEIGFEGVAMPWFHRGHSVQFVGLLAEDGVTPINLPPGVITSVASSYDESNAEHPAYKQHIRAFGWATG
jgi:hypothetical protein